MYAQGALNAAGGNAVHYRPQWTDRESAPESLPRSARPAEGEQKSSTHTAHPGVSPLTHADGMLRRKATTPVMNDPLQEKQGRYIYRCHLQMGKPQDRGKKIK